MKKTAHKPKSKSKEDENQSRLFIEKARELGADDDSTRSDELMKRLAKTPPEPKAKPSK